MDLLAGANVVWTTTHGPGSGFIQRVITSPYGDIAEDRVVTAVGSYSATAAIQTIPFHRIKVPSNVGQLTAVTRSDGDALFRNRSSSDVFRHGRGWRRA
jgi:hypothetical protein